MITAARNVRFQFVIAKLLDYVQENGLQPGSRLPSERTFEQMWQVSRPTVNKAIACLVAQGYLVREGYRLSVAAPVNAKVRAPAIHVLVSHAEYQRRALIRHDLVEAAHDGAATFNTYIIPLLAKSPTEQREQLRELLESGKCQAFVIWPLAHADLKDLLQQAADRRIPFVLCDLDLGEFNFVSTDNEYGAALAVRHLAELGHHELAYLTDDLTAPSLVHRKNGYEQACYANRLLSSIDRVIEIPSIGLETVREALNRLQVEYPEVTGLFCSNDLLAIHLLHLAHDAGLEVPRQLSLVGFDDIDVSSHSSPPLTTIAQDFHQLGVIATDMLLRQLLRGGDKTPVPPCRLNLHPQLIVRASTAPPRNS